MVALIRFSFDEGKCWFSHNFTDVGIIVTGLLAEPGEKSADVTVWGFDSHKTNKPWVSFNINFKTVMGKACKYFLIKFSDILLPLIANIVLV